MVRLATVGTSAITEKFLSACRLSGRFVLQTTYSRNIKKAEDFAKKQGFIDFCNDLHALASSNEIDAVYIATPNALHFAQSKLFLENGKHVLCEKPIVMSAAEFDELSQIAKSKGLVFMEAIMSHHSFSREILTEALGKIGNVAMARLDFCQHSSRYDDFKAGIDHNIFDMSLGGGTLTDLGIYCVWAAVDLFGEPLGIEASASFLRNGADGSGSAIFKYPDFIATLSYSKTGQSAIGSEIIGDEGAIKIGSISQYAEISLVKNGKEEKLLGMPERAEVMRGEADRFADYIENHADKEDITALTHTVHKCMDLIKQKANLKYPIKETVL